MTIYKKNNNVWTEINTPYINHNGTWKTPKEVYIRTAGNWKLVWPDEPELIGCNTYFMVIIDESSPYKKYENIWTNDIAYYNTIYENRSYNWNGFVVHFKSGAGSPIVGKASNPVTGYTMEVSDSDIYNASSLESFLNLQTSGYLLEDPKLYILIDNSGSMRIKTQLPNILSYFISSLEANNRWTVYQSHFIGERWLYEMANLAKGLE